MSIGEGMVYSGRIYKHICNRKRQFNVRVGYQFYSWKLEEQISGKSILVIGGAGASFVKSILLYKPSEPGTSQESYKNLPKSNVPVAEGLWQRMITLP